MSLHELPDPRNCTGWFRTVHQWSPHEGFLDTPDTHDEESVALKCRVAPSDSPVPETELDLDENRNFFGAGGTNTVQTAVDAVMKN